MNLSRFMFLLAAMTACAAASPIDDREARPSVDEWTTAWRSVDALGRTSSIDPIERRTVIEEGVAAWRSAHPAPPVSDASMMVEDAGPPARCDPRLDDCGDGVCVGGACVDVCPAAVWYERACEECTRRLVEESRCVIDEARCFECVTCPTAPDGFVTTGDGPLRPCRCERDGYCDVCIEQAERAWTCVLEACPVCST